jgi:predicted Co/Zn/Cd cation transporter (cation efflux family)
VDDGGRREALTRTVLDTRPEQRLLKLSIACTLAVGAIGVACGLWIHSDAIVFDGIYSLVDVALTAGSLTVSRLVALEGTRRFQYGFWHLEPMVEVFGGVLLGLACIYAAIDAVGGLISGGHVVEFGIGAAWAAVLALVGLSIAMLMRRKSRLLQSALLAMDSRTWLVSGLLSLALLIGFGCAIAMEGTRLAPWIPYLDSAILLFLSLAMLTVPVLGTWRAVHEVLQVAPGELDEAVRTTMQEVVERNGFLDFSSHVAKVGRARFVEVHILVPPGTSGTVDEADRIRRWIAERLDAKPPQFWLTVDFTTDRDWI